MEERGGIDADFACDLDGDGQIDVYLSDTNGDGNNDVALYDENHNGVIEKEIRILDTPGGRVGLYLVDDDEDGIWDRLGHDSDFDRKPDIWIKLS